MPDSFAAGTSPQTLMSFFRSLNGEVSKNTFSSRRASPSNLPRSRAVYPSPRIRRSSFSAGSPASCSFISAPTPVTLAPRSMNLSAGSTVVVHTSRKTFRGSRFFSTTRAGLSTAGKRSDSENVRFIFCASPVVSHSP
jgi:hypothetical protein